MTPFIAELFNKGLFIQALFINVLLIMVYCKALL